MGHCRQIDLRKTCTINPHFQSNTRIHPMIICPKFKFCCDSFLVIPSDSFLVGNSHCDKPLKQCSCCENYLKQTDGREEYSKQLIYLKLIDQKSFEGCVKVWKKIESFIRLGLRKRYTNYTRLKSTICVRSFQEEFFKLSSQSQQ